MEQRQQQHHQNIFALKYHELARRLEDVFVPPAEEPRTSLHVSMHYDTVSQDWWDAGARGACAYAVISEIVEEGGGAAVVAREGARTLYSCTVYFFADRVKMYAVEGTRDCYRNAVAAWLVALQQLPEGLRHDVRDLPQA